MQKSPVIIVLLGTCTLLLCELATGLLDPLLVAIAGGAAVWSTAILLQWVR